MKRTAMMCEQLGLILGLCEQFLQGLFCCIENGASSVRTSALMAESAIPIS